MPPPHERVWGECGPGPDQAGRPVVVGPAGADAARVGRALAALARLVAAGGAVAADAGADLGDGFRSARVEGGAGDRRDGMLAALRVAGTVSLRPLGPPAAIAVALFGVEVTRPLGAAATAAVAEGRWAALRLAVAAADLLGPEQVVTLLGVEAPAGTDPFPDGLPSTVGAHLARVLAPLPRARRLTLLLDLWERVGAEQADRASRERRRASRGRTDRLDDLVARFRAHDEEEILAVLRRSLGRDPTLADAALWTPPQVYRTRRADRVLHDCIGATVLARLAATATDDGPAEAMRRHRPEIAAAAARPGRAALARAARRVPGLTGLPARPGVILRDLDRRLAFGLLHDPDRRPAREPDHQPDHEPDRERRRGPDRRSAASDPAALLRDVTAHAYTYGQMARNHAVALLREMLDEPPGPTRDAYLRWADGGLEWWREAAGAPPPDRAAGWWQPPLLGVRDGASLAQAHPAPEKVGDLLWLADLAGAMARLDGHDEARVEYGEIPFFDSGPPDAEPEPLVPRYESIALAAAGTAQLAGLAGYAPGAEPARAAPAAQAQTSHAPAARAETSHAGLPPQTEPARAGYEAPVERARPRRTDRPGEALAAAVRRARTWPDLVGALLAATAVSEAMTGEFDVPAAALAADGTALPDGDERVEIARTARQPAEWAAYMGNCIAGPAYTSAAVAGRSVLVAVRAAGGHLLLNADLRPGARGWRIDDVRARFNADPEPELAARFRAWAATLSPAPDPGVRAEDRPPRRSRRRSLLADAEAGAASTRGRAGRGTPDPRARAAAEHGAGLGDRAAAELQDPAVATAIRRLAALARFLPGPAALSGAGTRPGAGTEPHAATRPGVPPRSSATTRSGVTTPSGVPPRSDAATPSDAATRSGVPPRSDVATWSGAAAGNGVATGSGAAAGNGVATGSGAAMPSEVLAGLTALRRAAPDALVLALARAFEMPGGLTPARIWRASAARPMRRALAAYDAPQLAALALDAPLPGGLRTLARRPGVAGARTADLVAVRVRAAMGALLRSGSPALGAARADLSVPLLCAGVLAVTSWSGPGVTVLGPRRVNVPGYPASALSDEIGPWAAAWPGAVELGADRAAFWNRIAEHGLLAPAGWLEPGGWAGTWARAHRHR
jgi:hypothetical protein